MASDTETVPLEEVLQALERVWEQKLKFGPADELRRRVPAGELAERLVRTAIEGIENSHPLRQPIQALAEAIIEEARAMDLLGETKPALKHARAIEEAITTIEFLVAHPALWEEFQWRWPSFRNIFHARLLIARKKVIDHPDVVKWIEANQHKLRQFYRFKRKIVDERDQWMKIQDWLYPTRIKDIYEAAGKLERYELTSYALNSHLVHVSPTGDYVFGVSPGERVTFMSVFGSPENMLVEFGRALEPVTARLDELRRATLAIALHQLLYRMGREQPERLLRLSREPTSGIAGIVDELLRDDFDPVRLETLVLGRRRPHVEAKT